MNEKIVTEWYESIYDVMDIAKQKGLVLCGNGYWSQIAKRICALFGVAPLCVVSDSSESNYESVPLQYALKQYPESIYISSADTVSGRNKWNLLLKREGVLTKESGLLFWRYAFLLDTGLDIAGDVEHEKTEIQSEDVNGLVFLNHMIHSGSMYFQETIDGHPNLLTIFFLGGVFKYVYLNRLAKLKGKRLWMEICAYMAKEYYTSIEKNDNSFPEATTLNASNFFFDKNGNFPWNICINPKDFFLRIKNQFSEDRLYSFGEVLKGLFVAYANTSGKRNPNHEKLWIVYDIHDPSMDSSDFEEFSLQKEFLNIKYFFLIRDPLQHFASICKMFRNASKDKVGDKLTIANIQQFLSIECGHTVIDKGDIDSYSIRFEDLKYKHYNIMEKICNILGIRYDTSLETTSFGGILVYDRRKTQTGYIYTTGNDASALADRKFEDVFSEYDIKRLTFLFSSFMSMYYPEFINNDILNYSESEMTESYKCFDDLRERIVYSGDIYHESTQFINCIYNLILNEMRLKLNSNYFYKLI